MSHDNQCLLQPGVEEDFQGFGGPAPAVQGAGAEPSEEAIRELTAMGFDRAMVIQALRAAQGDPTLATNILLNQFQ